MIDIIFSGAPGSHWCRQGAGYWHRPGAPCAPPRPDHFYSCHTSEGPHATPLIGADKVCEDCRAGV